jgi:hypothetical protein
MSVIHGLLGRIFFHNEENDFAVAKLGEKDKRELTSVGKILFFDFYSSMQHFKW